MTSMVVRTISTVCRRVMARVSSRGAVPKTSVEIAWGASGRRNLGEGGDARLGHETIQERFSGGMARYHGRVSSMRAMACAARLPEDFSSRFRVAAWGWTERTVWSAWLASGSGTGTRLPYRAGSVRWGSRRAGRTGLRWLP